MTIPVSTIVNVAIDRQTLFPQGPGFGTMLIVCPDTTANSDALNLTSRVKSYASMDEVAAKFASSTGVYKAANAYFSQNPRPTKIKVGMRDATPPGTFAAEMDAIEAVDSDWYAFILTEEARASQDAGVISSAAAAWCESKNHVFVTATNEAAVLNGTGGIPSTFADVYDRTATIYHDAANTTLFNQYPEAAFLGMMLTVDFNGANTTKTAKFKRLRAISPSILNSGQLASVELANSNAYVSIANNPMVMNGVMSTGEFFDVIHGIDWLSSEIQTRVFGKLATLPKVPYTESGMEILKNQVRLALKQGVTNGLLSSQFDTDGNLLDAYEVTSAPILSVSEANRSARIAPTITFIARLAGAVHKVQINGTVTI